MFRLFGAGVSKFNAIGLAVSAKTASFTVTQEGFYVVDASAAEVTVTLPPVDQANFALIWVKKTDNSANNVVIQGSGGETVEDGTVTLAARYTSVTLISDGTQWWII
jgi:hypothetical protein